LQELLFSHQGGVHDSQLYSTGATQRACAPANIFRREYAGSEALPSPAVKFLGNISLFSFMRVWTTTGSYINLLFLTIF
jgi:hypothetical protein